MDEDLQLNLFSWDRLKVGEGLKALARLNLTEAATMFEAVLSRWPGHPDASAGLRMAVAWTASLKEMEALQQKDGAATLWERIKAYPFGQGGEGLRQALIRRAIALLEGDDSFHLPPDMCLGRLLCEVEAYGQAKAALTRLLERRPFDGRLWVCLGNCLFRQGKQSEAGVVYAKAFLVAPWEVEREEVEDAGLLEAVSDVDSYWAAIYGWLRGALPLVKVEIDSPHDRRHEEALLVYHIVRRAERARAIGTHDEIVEQRRLLKHLAPAVFHEYMARL